MGATPHKAVTTRFPQLGGNRTSDASRVVFDPTLGGEGEETPPPNDSSIASLSPLVGGLLRSFRRDWQTIKCSDVLNIITNGYVLPFLSKPNLVSFPLSLSEYKARQRPSSGHLDPVSSVKERNRKGVSSNQALPKVEASHRPKQAQFKMETPESVRTSLTPGEWVSSIDLSDAYLHIPIHPNLRKYVKFCHRSEVFQFTSLPFRLSTAPQVFTNDCKGGEANDPPWRTQTSPLPG